MPTTDNKSESYVHLREYFETHLKDQKQYFEARLSFIEKGIELARQETELRVSASKEANERRLEILNEFRKTVEDWTRQSATKAELDGLRKEIKLEFEKMCILIKGIDDDIDSLEETRSSMVGKDKQTNMFVALGFSIFAAVVSVFVLALCLLGK